MNRLLAASITTVSVAVGTYSMLIWRRVSHIDSQHISSSDSATLALSRSKSASIINPRGHQAFGTSRSTTVQVPQGIGDEELLERFVKGFFGGIVFAPEGTILRLLRARLVDFPELEAKEAPFQIWSASDLHQLKLPPLHSILFGAFQVLEVHIEESHTGAEAPRQTNSYIDFGYHPTTGFAGFHRFSISRDLSDKDGAVTIEFADLVCNPTANQPIKLALLMGFHKVYAKLLFREAVAKTLKGL
ncbi:hypothetical protein BDV96DRAFT_39104 [Lophiotrema nucula]|uniref:Uncharacterized protein n=1 Tax=Lophiotrema nucula TaxID=690887 RepID=A0A6A5ZBV1_9PLEO|nr:hypothetical protein BDV96DRAFT_39104 [Lophiotrema nucula]